jgi:hypothetical protein
MQGVRQEGAGGCVRQVEGAERVSGLGVRCQTRSRNWTKSAGSCSLCEGVWGMPPEVLHTLPSGSRATSPRGTQSRPRRVEQVVSREKVASKQISDAAVREDSAVRDAKPRLTLTENGK